MKSLPYLLPSPTALGISLLAYGYELGPLPDLEKTIIPFAGTDVSEKGRQNMTRPAPLPICPPPANTGLPTR